MMTLPLLPNTELVTCAWLGEVFGNPAMVGTKLPQDNTTWAASGFVVVMAMGGARNTYVPIMQPYVSIDCWAVPLNKSSNKAPYGKANNIAETICRAARLALPHAVTLPGQFPKAQFFTANVLSEPRRIPDPGSYARYNFNLQVNWAPVTS